MGKDMTPTDVPLEQMHQAAQAACGLLKVLSNPDRLLILCYLSQREARVGELEEALGIVQPTLSQQLTVLRREKLVTTSREGKNIRYSLASPRAVAVIETLYRQFCCEPVPKKKSAKSSTRPSPAQAPQPLHMTQIKPRPMRSA
jgi:DNA-binding transcriptional ArsR family regulator